MSEIIRSVLLLLADHLTLAVPVGSLPAGKKRILVIKLDAIGDFILWLDAAKELHRLFPSDSCEIFLLGNRVWCDLAAEFPYFDHVWPLDRHQFIHNFSYRFKLMKKIRQAGFTTSVHPTFSRELFFGDEIVRISGVRERIGSAGNCTNTSRWGKLLSDQWYTRLVPAAPKTMMELERNAEFLRGLGLDDFRAANPNLKSLACRNAVSLEAPYFVIVPGAGVHLKQWPIANFKEVARRIHHLTGWQGVACGAAGEEYLGKDLVDGTDIPLRNLIGRTSLPELLSIIAGARIVIGNDSSAIHLAAAVETPAVFPLGGGQYGRFFPFQVEGPPSRSIPVPVVYKRECFGCDWRCLYYTGGSRPAPCISQISVDMVMSQIEKIISGFASEPHSEHAPY